MGKFVRVLYLETNKASISITAAALLIISLILLLILIVSFLNPVGKILNKQGEKSCNSFFKTKNFFSIFGVDVPFSASKEFCPPSFVKVKSSLDDDKIKKVFADNMIDCWNKYDRGNVELFSDSGSNYYCVLCSYITFEGEKKTVTGLKQFLEENYVPFYPYKDFTYLEFLSNCDLNECSGDFYAASKNDFLPYDNVDKDITIDTSKNYAVLYLSYENNAIIDKITAAQIASGAAIVSMVVLGVFTGGVPLIVYGIVGTATAYSTGKVYVQQTQ